MDWLFRWETALSVGAFLVGVFVSLASGRTTTRGFASWAIGAIVAPFLVTALALVIERVLWADRPELVFPLYVAAMASFFAAAFVLPRPPARRPTAAEQVKALRYVAILAAVAGVGGLLVGYQGVMLAVIGLPVAVGCVLAAQLVARRGTALATS